MNDKPNEKPRGNRNPVPDGPVRVLVSGANGHIGSCLLRGLPGAWHIAGIDTRPGNDPRVLAGDITAMEKTGLSPADFDVAIHLAADPNEWHSFEELLGPNIIACTAFLHWCAGGGIPRLIFASSCEAFLGRLHDDGPITIDGPFRPRNIYGCAKVYGEMLCRMLHLRHGCDTLAVRLGASAPDALDRELSSDPDYLKLRLPEAEMIEAFRRFVIEPWTGSREVFLGAADGTYMPTTESLNALFMK
ncbi:MAG: NAD(P)-dependent oxidoreductase [Chthoniobacteraceae bacterium]